MNKYDQNHLKISLASPRLARTHARRSQLYRVRQPRVKIGNNLQNEAQHSWTEYIDEATLYKRHIVSQGKQANSDNESWGETLRAYLNIATKLVKRPRKATDSSLQSANSSQF